MLFAWMVLTGCPGRADVVDACPAGQGPDTGADAEVCLLCDDDADCRLAGNPCYDTVLCAHEDEAHTFPDLGCADIAEHRWPDDSVCQCRSGVCRGSDR